ALQQLGGECRAAGDVEGLESGLQGDESAGEAERQDEGRHGDLEQREATAAFAGPAATAATVVHGSNHATSLAETSAEALGTNGGKDVPVANTPLWAQSGGPFPRRVGSSGSAL